VTGTANLYIVINAMNYRDSNIKRLLDTLSFLPTDRTPNLELLIEKNHIDHILGKSTIDRTWDLSPEDSVELALRTGMDTVCFSAIGQIAQVRRPGPDGSNMYVDGLIKTRDDLANYPLKQEMRASSDRLLRKAADIKVAAEGTGVGISVLVRSVFCNSYLAMGIENFMFNLHDSPQFVEEIMDIFLEYSLKVTKRLLGGHVDLIILDDDLADTSGVMIGLQRIKDMWVPRTREITDLLTRKGIPYIGHCCGNLAELMPVFIELGFLGIHPLQPNCNDIYDLKKEYKKKIALIGNIDITHPLSFGTPEEVEGDVQDHLDLLSEGGGYVLSSSHSIINKIPVENYEAMLRPLHV
jgi:uroporphyrinogen decarboxylase